MKTINAYEVRSEHYTIYSVSEDDILENIDKYSFNSFVCDMKVQIDEGILEFANEERPISVGYDYVYKNYLAINSNYYENNKDKVDELLLEIGKKIKTIYLYVDKTFVNDDLRKSLIDNNDIQELVIGSEKIR